MSGGRFNFPRWNYGYTLGPPTAANGGNYTQFVQAIPSMTNNLHTHTKTRQKCETVLFNFKFEHMYIKKHGFYSTKTTRTTGTTITFSFSSRKKQIFYSNSNAMIFRFFNPRRGTSCSR